MSLAPAASIIVINWNGAAYLRMCLDALLDQVTPEDEIIVVDNASTDGSEVLVAPYRPRVQLIANRRNLGYAGGANVGIQAAHGEVLILMNPDVRVHDGWLLALKQILTEETIAVAGCKLYYPDGETIQHAGGIIEFPMAVANHHGYRQQDDGRWDQVRDVDYVTGAAWALRRSSLEEVGLLDAGFHPAYYEEVDFCFRARAAGYRVVYEPRAVATHYEYAALGEESYHYLRYFHRHRLRFVLKHRGPQYFVDRLVPAEMTWLAQNLPAHPRHTFGSVYLDAMLACPRLLGDQQVVTMAQGDYTLASVLEALADLRHHVWIC